MLPAGRRKMNSDSINWDAIFAENQSRIYRYIFSKIRHPQDAEDLCQQVFLKTYRGRDGFDPAKSAPGTWIYNIARTAVIDFFRSRKNYGSLNAIEGVENLLRDEADSPELKLLTSENQDLLAGALIRLEEQERDLIILHYFEETSLTEIARLMALPYGRVKRMHARALGQLKLMLAEII